MIIEFERAMSPGEKLSRALKASAFVLAATRAGLKQQYPDADDREIFLRLTRMRLGSDLFGRVYGNTIE